MSLRLIAPLALAAALAPVAGLAADRPVVVELFTSQGCSSCPPANAYLNELVRDRSDVLALAFHVTYWDRLGWKDPFSMEAATERQDRYGHRFGDGSYTPEMVVDGAAGMVGSDRGDVGSAIENAKRNSRTAAAVSVTKNGEQVSIEVGSGSEDDLAAVLDDMLPPADVYRHRHGSTGRGEGVHQHITLATKLHPHRLP